MTVSIDTTLADAMHELRREPFAYGSHDCCLFAANVLQRLTGVDFMPEFRGRYQSPRAAVQLIRAHGGLRNILRQKFGAPVPVQQARRGDVVVVHKQTLGICLGARAAIPAKPRGVVFVPMSEALEVYSWRP